MLFRPLRYLPATALARRSLPGAVRGLSADARDLFRRAQCVCFDVDSTVIQEEGVDVLAAFKGKGEAVAALTAK